MSGGHFDYKQFKLSEIADDIDQLIAENEDQRIDKYGDTVGRFYPDDIIEKFREAAHWVRRAEEMINRIDWLVSDDDGIDSFRERWGKEVRKP